MTFGVYAMRDVKTGFMAPVTDSNDEAAVRNFFHTVQNAEGVLFSFAQDFSLYRIGDYDADTGALSPLTPIVFLASGAHAVAVMRGADDHA